MRCGELEGDAQTQRVGRTERERRLNGETVLRGILSFEFRRLEGEDICHREVEREVGERHFLELALRELVAERDVREAEIAARNDAHIGIVVHRPVVVGKRFETFEIAVRGVAPVVAVALIFGIAGADERRIVRVTLVAGTTPAVDKLLADVVFRRNTVEDILIEREFANLVAEGVVEAGRHR